MTLKFYPTPGLLFLLLSGIIVFSGCRQKGPEPSEIVAKVGNSYLTVEMVNNLVPENISDQEKFRYKKSLVDRWIERQMMAQQAEIEGIELSPEDNWKLENMKADILATKLLEKKVRKNIPVTDKEIEDYYEKNKDQFRREKDEVYLVHLFLEKLDKAIVREIKQSKMLMDVIQKNFLEGQANRLVEPNGDLGYVAVSDLNSKFRWAIRGKKTGIIYGPIRTKYGYHFLQVLDRQPAESIRSLELVRDEIIKTIRIEKRQQMIKNLKESIKKELPIETFYTNLK